jgi:protoporphyrinogen oxidase
MDAPPSVICIGAGPAGLTAAHVLSAAGLQVTVLEQDPVHVGGISRTVSHNGFHFDIGGHRFFSKSAEIERFWSAILGPDLLVRRRKSRIYYRGKLFDYPLKGRETVAKLGFVEATLCVLSYVKQVALPIPQPKNFEDWVTNQFGARLFRIFFKTYTEKVWGMSCNEISADWAAQRIRGLSLAAAIRNALFPQKPQVRSDVIKTLMTEFRYPRKGPGMMWQAVADQIRASGGRIVLGTTVTELARDGATGRWSVAGIGPGAAPLRFAADHVISSMPMRELVAALRPGPSASVRAAAGALRYRDFVVVALVVRDRQQFDDHWLYIHDPTVKVGRIQNFKSWSPDMVPDRALNGYGMEYFCHEGDALWASSDAALVTLAARELAALGLAAVSDIVDGHVVRQRQAYPVYDDGYEARVDLVRRALAADYSNLQLVGRNGMHKYNNQDHAMMTAMLAARNVLAGAVVHDLWSVNQDAEYQESGAAGSRAPIAERLVPRRAAE